MSKSSLFYLQQCKQRGEKIAAITAYDASFAALAEQAGMDWVLVGDSLGMVVQGQSSTLPVTLDHMVYHAQAVARGLKDCLMAVDMPFMTYATPTMALANAARLLQEGSASMVKLEGGAWLADTVRLLVERGIPVCGHIGLTPQSVHQLGGYRVQGKTTESAAALLEHARCLQAAGAALLVLECIPARLAREVSAALTIPVIGIGAGVECDGQILVLYDALGITPGKRPRFVKNFLGPGAGVAEALRDYVQAVKHGKFPTAEHEY